jgi:hypothetical protein
MLMPSPAKVIAGLTGADAREPRTIELWDAWAFAELDAEFALSRWWEAPPDDRAIAFHAYRAALDREAHAASVLEKRLVLTGAGAIGAS